MNVDAASHADGDAGWAPLIDVGDMPVAGLFAPGNPTLERTVRRLVESLDDPDGTISAFSSFAS